MKVPLFSFLIICSLCGCLRLHGEDHVVLDPLHISDVKAVFGVYNSPFDVIPGLGLSVEYRMLQVEGSGFTERRVGDILPPVEMNGRVMVDGDAIILNSGGSSVAFLACNVEYNGIMYFCLVPVDEVHGMKIEEGSFFTTAWVRNKVNPQANHSR